MKIVHILTYTFENGGSSKVVYDLCKYQIKCGHNPIIINHNINGETLYKEIPGVEIRTIKSNRISKFFPMFSFKLFEILKNEKFDVIHLHGLWNFPIYACSLLNLQKKCIVTVHGCLHPFTFNGKRLKKNIFTLLFQRAFLRKVKLIHVLHENEKNEVLDYLKSDYRNILCVPNGIELPENDISFKKSGLDILFLSRLHFKKGLDLLLPAFKNVLSSFPEAKLILAGPDFGMLDFVNQFIETNNLQNSIIVKGPVHGDLKDFLLRNSQVFVLPSYSEGFSIAVLEALAYGLPIVVSAETGFSEEILKSNSGKIIEFNIDSISNSIIEVLSNKSSTLELIENGKRLVQEKFEIGIISKLIMDEINQKFNLNE